MAQTLTASEFSLIDLNSGLENSQQPVVSYDLLPRHLKSNNFTLRFDLVAPRARFVFVHRSGGSFSYSDLGAFVREELFWTALSFANAFELGSCSVSIPLGPSQSDETRILAFLNVANTDRFFAVLKEIWPQLPQNTDERWRSEYWPPACNDEESILETLEAAVRNSCLVEFVERKLLTPKTSFLSVAQVSDRMRLHRHQFESLVGVSLPDAINSSDTRWSLLDHLHWLTTVLNDQDFHPAIISVSLSSPFDFNGTENIFGMIRFPHQLPTAFQAVLPAIRSDVNEVAPTSAELAKIVLETWTSDSSSRNLKQTRRFSDLGSDRDDLRSRRFFRRVSDNPMTSRCHLSSYLAEKDNRGLQLLSVKNHPLNIHGSAPEISAENRDDPCSKPSGKKFFQNFFKRTRGSNSGSRMEETKIEINVVDTDAPADTAEISRSPKKEESGPNFARRASQFISNIPENLKVARDERRKTSTLPSAEALSERRPSDALLSLYLFS